MANITVAEGGGIVANGVVSLLPQCASVSYESLSLQDAERYDITSSSYLVVRLRGGRGRSAALVLAVLTVQGLPGASGACYRC